MSFYSLERSTVLFFKDSITKTFLNCYKLIEFYQILHMYCKWNVYTTVLFSAEYIFNLHLKIFIYGPRCIPNNERTKFHGYP